MLEQFGGGETFCGPDLVFDGNMLAFSGAQRLPPGGVPLDPIYIYERGADAWRQTARLRPRNHATCPRQFWMEHRRQRSFRRDRCSRRYEWAISPRQRRVGPRRGVRFEPLTDCAASA